MKTKFDLLYMFHKNFSFLLKTTQINFKIRDSISRQSENLLRILIDDFNSHTVIVDSCSIIVCWPWPTIALLLNRYRYSQQSTSFHPFAFLCFGPGLDVHKHKDLVSSRSVSTQQATDNTLLSKLIVINMDLPNYNNYRVSCPVPGPSPMTSPVSWRFVFHLHCQCDNFRPPPLFVTICLIVIDLSAQTAYKKGCIVSGQPILLFLLQDNWPLDYCDYCFESDRYR